MLTDGVPASFAVKMENAHLLAVNGTPLRWPILLRLVPGAAMPPAAPAVAEQVPIAAPMTVDQELPPPQEDGVGQLLCANCGAENPAGARFCNTCGAPLVNDIEPTDENPSDENPTDDN
ncbi:MAG TPA: zinc ribbon domain-containing protein [Candidatus Lokiarchaeia archaeon]|nr:zinc ribbon domain-containing protein [Candidatus Lokiarchaeia archaeon]